MQSFDNSFRICSLSLLNREVKGVAQLALTNLPFSFQRSFSVLKTGMGPSLLTKPSPLNSTLSVFEPLGISNFGESLY